MNIQQFLALPHRFRWGGVGGDDCLTFPSSWAMRLVGKDPAEEFRGTYRSRDEAHSLLDRHGGHLAFATRQLQAVNARRVQIPETGDIGLIKTLAGDTPSEVSETIIGAICFGPLWACIHPVGIRATNAEFIAAWRLTA